jgi:hypothetical protein
LQSEQPFVPTAQQRMLLDLTRNFLNIPKQEHREALTAVARALANQQNEEALAA